MTYRELHHTVLNMLRGAAAQLGLDPESIDHGTRQMPAAAPAMQFYVDLGQSDDHIDQSQGPSSVATVTVFALADAQESLAETRIAAVEMSERARAVLIAGLDDQLLTSVPSRWDNDYPGYTAAYHELLIHIDSIV